MKKIFNFSPITKRRWQRFKAAKRGFVCFWLFILVTLFAFSAELFINSRALMVSYNGKLHFPILRSLNPLVKNKHYSGKDFGENYTDEASYRKLKKDWKTTKSKNWVLMTMIPYGANEHDKVDITKIKMMADKELAPAKAELELAKQSGDEEKIKELTVKYWDEKISILSEAFPPLAPNLKNRHILGTDPSGLDVFARLIYGYRIAIIFSLTLMFFAYTIGITVGCLMGYYGGWFDLAVQRIIEILSRVPFIYIMMILAVVVGRSFFILVGLMVLFGWMGMTRQMRTATYREKARDYIMAARSLGASDFRIIFSHIIPSTIALIVTFIPFSISGGIMSLTSLDFLGFGLPPGTPSWGELMKIGTQNMNAPWIVGSVVCAMVFILFLVNMIGEAIREAFDPKKFTKYE